MRLPKAFPRPMPPASFDGFAPAPEVLRWIRGAILDEGGPLFNREHRHLERAKLRVLWAAPGCKRQGIEVIGMMEIPRVQGHQWLKARVDHQLTEWFGCVPQFLMTLSAGWCADADNASFCALVEHELYHAAQAKDQWGSPRFNRVTGEPVYTIRGHDVEQFVGVVRRYGVTDGGGKVQELVDAANRPPAIAPAKIAAACGTCLRV